MKINSLLLILLFTTSTWALPPGVEVNVTFKNVEKYTDFGRYKADKIENQAALEKHMKQLGERLAAGQKLNIEVLDVDLSGSYEITSRTESAFVDLDGRREPINTTYRAQRVLTEASWPTMKLHYILEVDGKVTVDNTETLKDLGYLGNANVYSTGDNRRYEKNMLDKWFLQHIIAQNIASK